MATVTSVSSTVTGFDDPPVVPPDDEVPSAVAVSEMDPCARSASVTVCVPMNVAVCPGTNVVVVPEQVPAGELRLRHVGVTPSEGKVGWSVTLTSVMVTLPVSTTVKV